MTPTWGTEAAPDGGLRIFVDLSEHEIQAAGVDSPAHPDIPLPVPSELEASEPPPREPSPSA